MDYLEEEWLSSLPKTETCFPKSVRLQYLKERMREKLDEIQALRNKRSNDSAASAIWQIFIDAEQKELDELSKKYHWLKKPKNSKDKQEVNIQKAKEYPMSELVTIQKNLTICLWHDDKHPSMKYYPKTNTLYCFVCNRAADTIDIVQKKFDLTFLQAIKKLT